jgi:hypothetical protein
VPQLPSGLAVPDVRLRLRCSKWGKLPAETRPDWTWYRSKGRLLDMATAPKPREIFLDGCATISGTGEHSQQEGRPKRERNERYLYFRPVTRHCTNGSRKLSSGQFPLGAFFLVKGYLRIAGSPVSLALQWGPLPAP